MKEFAAPRRSLLLGQSVRDFRLLTRVMAYSGPSNFKKRIHATQAKEFSDYS